MEGPVLPFSREKATVDCPGTEEQEEQEEGLLHAGTAWGRGTGEAIVTSTYCRGGRYNVCNCLPILFMHEPQTYISVTFLPSKKNSMESHLFSIAHGVEGYISRYLFDL